MTFLRPDEGFGAMLEPNAISPRYCCTQYRHNVNSAVHLQLINSLVYPNTTTTETDVTKGTRLYISL